MKDYCGTLNVKAIRANLFLVHELLEENMDFGIFQCLNTSDLRTLGKVQTFFFFLNRTALISSR